MKFRQLCEEYHIDTAPPGHKHAREGWVNVPCPFCTGNPGYHLGYEETKDRFRCWRCGFKKHMDVVMRLTGVGSQEARLLLRRFKGRPRPRVQSAREVKRRRISKLKMPAGCGPMTEAHRRYLRGRGFDPDRLARLWGLLGTGPIGDYKFRVIAPISHEDELVSYQGRDITGKHPLKYKACPQSEEVMDHHHTLYGLDKVPGDAVVVVEGIADVWRLGYGAVATFGIAYTRQQVSLLRGFRSRFVMFDSGDPQALEQARVLAAELSAFKGSTEIVTLDAGDPGEMGQEEADALMRELLT